MNSYMVSLLVQGFVKNSGINIPAQELGDLQYLVEQACLLTLNHGSYGVMDYSWNKTNVQENSNV